MNLPQPDQPNEGELIGPPAPPCNSSDTERAMVGPPPLATPVPLARPLPLAAPAVEPHLEEAGVTSNAPPDSTTPVARPVTEQQPPAAKQRTSSRESPTSTRSSRSTPAAAAPPRLPAASALRSSRVLAPFAEAGLRAAVISWSPDDPSGAKIGSSKNCSSDEAQEMILRVAAKLIKKRWPELYPLLAERLDERLEASDVLHDRPRSG